MYIAAMAFNLVFGLLCFLALLSAASLLPQRFHSSRTSISILTEMSVTRSLSLCPLRADAEARSRIWATTRLQNRAALAAAIRPPSDAA
jgi:hypothetical protein